MDIKRFVFTGDSAGGHLTHSVSFLAMLRNFRLPDGIFSFYPVFTSDVTTFFPSVMMSTDDEVLSTGFLVLVSACANRYGCDIKASPILSPLIAPDAMLRLMPKCYY